MTLQSFLLISAALLAIVLASCAPKAEQFAVAQRQLPDRPAFARTVAVAKERPEDSCYVKHAEERTGRIRANSIITRYNSWYDQVKLNYSAKN